MEYKIVAFNATDYKDPNNNYWCNIALAGISEPIKIAVKDPTMFKAGDTIYGRITEETSKAGKPYQRFRREKAPEQAYVAQNDKPSPEYWDNKQAQIKAQWAINQSREYIQHMLGTEAKLEQVLDTAKLFFNMVDHVVNQEVVTGGKDEVTDFDPNDTDIINLDDIPF